MSLKHVDHRAVIPPITETSARPLWSVMIPTHNCARFLRETLESVLQQDPGPTQMQIEVIDDHSMEDDPEVIVREVGKGRVNFYRQPQNVGHTRNFETSLLRSRGHLIHQLHGDDMVRDGFYRKMELAFAQHPEIGAAFCRTIFMDEQGHWQTIVPLEQRTSGILNNWLQQLAVEQRIHTPGIVVRRTVYEQLGGFDRRLSWTEDWEMWTRIATKYPFWYEVEPLALYRVHSSSNTGRYITSGESVCDTCRAIEIIQTYLPPELAPAIKRQARQQCALSALAISHQLLLSGNQRGSLAQIREAIRVSMRWTVWKRLLVLLYNSFWGTLRWKMRRWRHVSRGPK